jgi:hypothetical protein
VAVMRTLQPTSPIISRTSAPSGVSPAAMPPPGRNRRFAGGFSSRIGGLMSAFSGLQNCYTGPKAAPPLEAA